MNNSAARKFCGDLLDSRLARTGADLQRVAKLIERERKELHRLHNGEQGDSAGNLVARVLSELTSVLASTVPGLSSAAGEFDTVVSKESAS